MLTYTGALTIYQDLSNNSETANTTRFNTTFNIGNRKVLSAMDWYFLHKSADITTVASTQNYDLPYDTKKVNRVTVTVGTTAYTPREAPSLDFWNQLNQTTSTTSDIPDYWFVFNNDIYLYPTPTSASNTITVYYSQRIKDITIADYTTGTIKTATNGDETIVGNATSWTAKMADQKWLRITESNTANTGDGEWYEISSITDSTNLELVEPYAGTSIAAGTAAYILGEVSQIPEDYQELPVYYALWVYYASIVKDKTIAKEYKDLFYDGLAEMRLRFGNQSESPSIEDTDISIDNPNLFIEA